MPSSPDHINMSIMCDYMLQINLCLLDTYNLLKKTCNLNICNNKIIISASGVEIFFNNLSQDTEKK